jgi:FAD-linked oxidoreductase
MAVTWGRRAAGTARPGWRSWSGSVRATPATFARPTSVAELVDLVGGLDGRTARVVGSGHSFTPLAVSDDVMVSLADLPGEVVADPGGRSAVVGAGLPLRAVGRELDRHGLALRSMGDIDHQAVAGALSTGTHGTGGAVGPMHADVLGVELVDGTGRLRWVDEADLPAARLALGTLGVITRLRLAVQPAYRLATRVTKVTLDDVLTDLDHHVADHRHAEFYWLPHTRWCQLRLSDATDEPAAPVGIGQRLNDVVLENAAVWLATRVGRASPASSAAVARLMARGIADVASRRPSHDAFASVRVVRFVEMEYAVPRAALTSVIEALDRLITAERLPVVLPVEVRAVAADTSAWLSPAWARDSAYVALHAVRGMPHARYLTAAEEILRGHDGRPHWGKLHSLGERALQRLYPGWAEFQAVRAAYDPAGAFTSPYVRRLLG